MAENDDQGYDSALDDNYDIDNEIYFLTFGTEEYLHFTFSQTLTKDLAK